jgi:hypothetical protein
MRSRLLPARRTSNHLIATMGYQTAYHANVIKLSIDFIQKPV